jgi:hypothetical protein
MGLAFLCYDWAETEVNHGQIVIRDMRYVKIYFPTLMIADHATEVQYIAFSLRKQA